MAERTYSRKEELVQKQTGEVVSRTGEKVGVKKQEVIVTVPGVESTGVNTITEQPGLPEKQEVPTEEPKIDGRRMTPADLTPEQKAEFDAIVKEQEEKMKPLEAELSNKKDRWQELYTKQLSPSEKNIHGQPGLGETLTTDEQAEYLELGDTIREIQAEYDALANYYSAKRISLAGYTFGFTGASPAEVSKAREQRIELGKGGKAAFDYAVTNGLIKDEYGNIIKDAIFVPGEGKAWGYTTPQKQREQINALVSAGVLTTEDLRGMDLNTDLTGKFKLAVETYNRKQFQAAINDLVAQGVLDSNALKEIGSDTSLFTSQEAMNEAQKKIQKYIDAYNLKIESEKIKWESDLKEFDPEGFKVYKDKGYDAYVADVERRNKEIMAAKTVPETDGGITVGGQRYENEAELRAYGQELASKNPALFKVFKEAFYSGNWGAFEQAVQSYNDQIEAEEKQFKLNHTQLPDGDWMTNIELAKIKAETPKLYEALLSKGFTNTYGYLEKLEKENPKLYIYTAQKYGIIPDNVEYYDTLPNGTVRVIDKKQPDYGPKTVGELVKKIGGEAGDVFVPFMWTRNLKIEKQPDGTFITNIPTWQIGLNLGLDLVTVIPGVGWVAKGVGRSLLKAGTATIEKSLTKELAKELVKVGEKSLAKDAIRIGKMAPEINKAAIKLEKASEKAAGATFYRDIKGMAKTYEAERVAKTALVDKLQTFGNDIAELNAKAGVKLKGVGKEALSKTVGISAQANDFAEYIAGTAKDLRTAELSSKYFGKTSPVTGAKIAEATKNAIREVTELPKTIKEVATASRIAVTPEKLSLNQISKMTNDEWVKWGQKVWKGQDVPTNVVEVIKGRYPGVALGQFSTAGNQRLIKIAKFTNPQQAIKTYLHELGHARTLTPSGRKEIDKFINDTILKRINSPKNIGEARYAIGEMAAEHSMRIQGLSPTGKDYIKAYRTIISRITDKQTAKEAEKFALQLAKTSVKHGAQVELRVFGKQIQTGKVSLEYKGGLGKAAAYLRGEVSTTAKAKTATEIAAMGKREADKYLSNLQSQLRKESAVARARAEKYLGKQATLDKWDAFIKESWHPKSPYVAGKPSIWGTPRGGVGTIVRTGGGVRVSAKGVTAKGDLSMLGGAGVLTFITPDGKALTISEPGKVIAPGKVPYREPVKTPERKPSKIPFSVPLTRPGKTPLKEPVKEPSKTPLKVPAISPAIYPAIEPMKVPGRMPERMPSKVPVKAPAKTPEMFPSKTPIKVPARVPEPSPAKTPVKAPVKTPVKLRIKTPTKIIPKIPPSKSTEGEETISAEGGQFTWKQGELHEKPVFQIGTLAGGKVKQTATLGNPPPGAIILSGKGQAKKTLKVIKGKAPEEAVTLEGGAVDPTISPIGDNRISIEFNKDLNISRQGRISRRTPGITARMPRISPKMRRLA